MQGILANLDAAKVLLVVSNTGQEVNQDEPEKPVKTVVVLSEHPNKSGAPIRYNVAKAPIAASGTEVHLQKADREKLVKAAEVNERMSLSQWSELLGFRRSSSAHTFLQRMSDKDLVDLQNTLEGVSVRLNNKGKSAINSFEMADIG